MTRTPVEAAATRSVAPAAAGWGERLKVFAFLALYTNGFWGQAGRLLPAPLDDWHGVPYRLLAEWWHAHVLPHLPPNEQLALFQVAEGYLFGLVLPLLALRSLGFAAREVGLGRAPTLGLPTTAAGVVLTLPVGFWLATVTPEPWGTPRQEVLEFLCIVPEHGLIFGVFGVLLLPGHLLRWPAPHTGQMAAGLFTVSAASLVFGLVHIGTPHPAELIAAVPLGLLFAVMTFLSGSIWPAVIAHVTLNLVPMALLPAGG